MTCMTFFYACSVAVTKEYRHKAAYKFKHILTLCERFHWYIVLGCRSVVFSVEASCVVSFIIMAMWNTDPRSVVNCCSKARLVAKPVGPLTLYHLMKKVYVVILTLCRFHSLLFFCCQCFQFYYSTSAQEIHEFRWDLSHITRKMQTWKVPLLCSPPVFPIVYNLLHVPNLENARTPQLHYL